MKKTAQKALWGGSWASLGLSRPPFGTLLASPLAIQIVPEAAIWQPVVPKDLPRGSKRAPGHSRDAFLTDFSHFGDRFWIQKCDFQPVLSAVFG